MKIVTLLTTYNRPKLLKQALEHIERECNKIDSELVIADDNSDNYHTIRILEDCSKRNIEVIQRGYYREHGCNPHPLVGLINQYAFLYIIKNYQPDIIIKVDDDIVMIDGAFQRMLDARQAALDDGYEILATSGICGKFETATHRPEGKPYKLVTTPCAAGCIYESEDMRICFSEISSSEIAINGFDWSIWNQYRAKWKPNSIAVCTAPGSVVGHASLDGVHVLNQEINVEYEGSLEGIIREG